MSTVELVVRVTLLLAGILIGIFLAFIADQIDTWMITKHINARYSKDESK